MKINNKIKLLIIYSVILTSCYPKKEIQTTYKEENLTINTEENDSLSYKENTININKF